MDSVKKQLDLNFLKDSPILSSEPNYYDFYHKYISPALHKITLEKGIQTIGLFGSWGSGKSTIIENLKIDYSEYPVFVFDAWRYKGDPLRRTFLVKLFEFVKDKENKLEKTGEELPSDFLDDFYLNKTEAQKFKIKFDSEGKLPLWAQKIIKIIKKNLLLFLILTFAFSWSLMKVNLGNSYLVINQVIQFVAQLGQSTVFATIIIIFLKQAFEWLANRFLSSLESEEQFKIITKTRNALDSPEQFEEKFKKIIEVLSKRIVIVFDNIDRVQGDVAISTLATIKTFFDPRENNNVTFIIPCDSDAIEKQIKKYYGGAENFSPSEYLRKLFNVVIWTPDFIADDLEDFATKLLGQLGKDSSLLSENDELIRVITQAFKSNPREIKQFLNNFVASLLVVSDTEVWPEVKKNLPYLAKVLVLRQNYSEAYGKLKDNWFNPEGIVGGENENQELRNFMVSTGNITTTNAEPFIYYKLSNIEKDCKDAASLLPALVGGDLEKSKIYMSKNKSKPDALLKFIVSLYGKYRSQSDWLTNIIHTFLEVNKELDITLSPSFINRTGEAIERDIWQNYKQLNTDIIFQKFINNNTAKKELRDNLLGRYITVLGSQEIIEKKDGAIPKSIINNLVTVKDIPDTQLLQVKNLIETTYIIDQGIFSLFNTLDIQKRFVTKVGLEKYIQGINLDNFQTNLPSLLLYRAYIAELDLNNVLINIFIGLSNQEKSRELEHNGTKQVLYEDMAQLIQEPDDILSNSDTNLLASLENEVMAAYKGITDVNNKYYLIPVLYDISIYLHDTHLEIEEQADNLVTEFIQTVNKEVLDNLLASLNKATASGIVAAYCDYFIDKGVKNGGEDIETAYALMDLANQQRAINSLIDLRDDLGFSYFSKKTTLPNKTETIRKVLPRGLASSVKNEAYEWIANSINKSTDVTLKEAVSEQLKVMLKTDDQANQETGYTFLSKINFLSKEQKQNLGDDLIAWLKTPGKVIASVNRYTLKAVSLLFNDLSQTKKNEFIMIVFDMLSRQDDRPVNTVAIEIIKEISANWKSYQSYYDDFQIKVDKWPNADDRNFVIEELIKSMRAEKSGKREQRYWEGLDNMRNNKQQS